MDIHQLVQDVIDGNESPLLALAILRQELKEVQKCIKQIEDEAMEEAMKYEEKSFSFRGYEFEKRSGGRTFSYKHIPEWIKLNNAQKEFEEMSKQAFLSQEKGIAVAQAGTGEEIPLPEVTNRKDSIAIKPSK